MAPYRNLIDNTYLLAVRHLNLPWEVDHVYQPWLCPPSSPTPATTTPEFTASDNFLYKPTMSYPGVPTTPTAWQASLPHDGTIDPSLMTRGDYKSLLQHNPPSISSTSTEGWMGYSGDEAPMLVGILIHKRPIVLH